jgi:hypothetical protein
MVVAVSRVHRCHPALGHPGLRAIADDPRVAHHLSIRVHTHEGAEQTPLDQRDHLVVVVDEVVGIGVSVAPVDAAGESGSILRDQLARGDGRVGIHGSSAGVLLLLQVDLVVRVPPHGQLHGVAADATALKTQGVGAGVGQPSAHERLLVQAEAVQRVRQALVLDTHGNRPAVFPQDYREVRFAGIVEVALGNVAAERVDHSADTLHVLASETQLFHDRGGGGDGPGCTNGAVPATDLDPQQLIHRLMIELRDGWT